MNFNCEQKILAECLNNVSKAVSHKSTIQVLEGILIEAKENEIKLYGYNLEFCISTKIKSEIIEKGKAVINARLLTEIVKKLESDKIKFKKNSNNSYKINADFTECNINGYETSEYPEIPSEEGDEIIKIQSEVLKELIQETIFSTSSSDQNPVYKGILFEIEEKILKLIAVDGFRLAIKKEKVNNIKQNEKFIIPNKTLIELLKLLKQDEEITILKNNKNIIFKTNSYSLITRVLEGEFLDYKSVIEKESKNTITIDKNTIKNSIERASLMITNERTKNPIILEFKENEIEISCSTSVGYLNDIIKCENKEKNSFKIGFNNKYLIEALNVIKDEKINILTDGPTLPIKIVPIENDDYIYLILPVRLKAEENKE